MQRGHSPSGNRSITMPLREPACSFSYAVFQSGRVSPRHVSRPSGTWVAWGGAEAPWHVRDCRQGASTSHGARIPQAAEASVLAADIAAQPDCESPL
jgi:hypothetical protein